jgi:hypothetical protein
MNRAIITADALTALSRIFVSCKPIMNDILVANQRYLVQKAKEGNNVYYDEFVGKLPQPYPNYENILNFALARGNDITETSVQLFFGGEPHFEKIIKEVNDPKLRLKKDFALKILFAHILIPARITRISPSIEATYENFGQEVTVKNLVALDRDVLDIGKTVLVHYASIVSDNPKPDVVANLLEVQARYPEFIEACRYVREKGGLDYEDFWDLGRFTRETIADRCL